MTKRRLGWCLAVMLPGALGLGGGLVALIVWANRPATEDIGRLIERLADEDDDRCREAAKALGDLGPEARAAVPYLRAVLEDDDPRVRLPAATALWKIDRQAEPLLRELGQDFSKNFADSAGRGPAQREDLNDAWQALLYGFMGMRRTPSGYVWEEGQSEATALALADGLRYEDVQVRRGAAFLLFLESPLLPATGVLIPALARSVEDEDFFVRCLALEALGKLGPAAAEAAPTLRAALASSATRTACGAAALLGARQPPACVLLAQSITLEEREREWLAKVLQQIDPEAARQARGRD
jgi:HEAT repeat protein